MRRVLVTGSREWLNRTAIWAVLNRELEQHPEGIIVVHGKCRTGADDIADRWAAGMKAIGLPVEIEEHEPDFDAHGDRAPLVRNREMAESGPDVCHAFPIEGSHGTRHCMTRAMAAGVPVHNHGYQAYTSQSREFAEAFG